MGGANRPSKSWASRTIERIKRNDPVNKALRESPRPRPSSRCNSCGRPYAQCQCAHPGWNRGS